MVSSIRVTPRGTRLKTAFGFYVQDSFRVNPRLTLNFGLRYDYFGVVGEKNNLLSNITSVAPSTGDGTFTLTQVGQPGLKSLYNPDKKDFAPRISAAWDVTGKGRTVVRAGFGIFYDAFSQDMVLGHLPYPTFFSPGPAYNPVGPSPIISATITGNLDPGVPVYAAPSCADFECDTFGFRSQHQNALHGELQPQHPAATGQPGRGADRVRRLTRASFVEILRFEPAQRSYDKRVDQACDCIQDFGSDARPFGGYGTGNPYASYYVMQENSTGKSNYNCLAGQLCGSMAGAE